MTRDRAPGRGARRTRTLRSCSCRSLTRSRSSLALRARARNPLLGSRGTLVTTLDSLGTVGVPILCRYPNRPVRAHIGTHLHGGPEFAKSSVDLSRVRAPFDRGRQQQRPACRLTSGLDPVAILADQGEPLVTLGSVESAPRRIAPPSVPDACPAPPWPLPMRPRQAPRRERDLAHVLERVLCPRSDNRLLHGIGPSMVAHL